MQYVVFYCIFLSNGANESDKTKYSQSPYLFLTKKTLQLKRNVSND